MSIQIVAAGGSVRPGNFTAKALALAVDELRKREDVEVRLVDPSGVDLRPPARTHPPRCGMCSVPSRRRPGCCSRRPSTTAATAA